jgi:hypothetical protein
MYEGKKCVKNCPKTWREQNPWDNIKTELVRNKPEERGLNLTEYRVLHEYANELAP